MGEIMRTGEVCTKCVMFIFNALWFAARWSPVSVKFNNPRFLWRLSKQRHLIKAAIQRGSASYTEKETTRWVKLEKEQAKLQKWTKS